MDTQVISVIDEVEARWPGFLRAHPVTVGSEDLESAMGEGRAPAGAEANVIAALATHGIRLGRGRTGDDPLARELLRGMQDAWHTDLAPEGATMDAGGDLVGHGYTRIASGAIRGYVADQAGKPLLLLNALGLPLRIWSRLLAGGHGHRLIVPELPSCDLAAGGMTRTMSATEVAEYLSELLEHLALPAVDVLAWCNSGRIGVELQRIAGDAVGTLVLLSPSFRGGVTPSDATSAYEDNLDRLLSLARVGEGRVERVAAMLRRPQPAPDWAQLADRPAERAAALFALPRRGLEDDLKVPVVSAGSLSHYIRRTYLDEALTAALSHTLPGDRVAAILGSHDSIVSNRHTLEWLDERAPGFAAYEVSGSAHYIHDLQFPYLLHLLDRILLTRDSGAPMPARVRPLRPLTETLA